MSIVCPKCERSDSIQKISAIYTEGVTTASSGNYTAVSKTQLAERLKQPKEPPKSKILSPLEEITGVMTSSLLPSFLVYVLFGGFSSAFNFLNWLIAYAAVCLLLAFFLLPKRRNESREKVEAHDKWERQISNWWELYYCRRDDCVFDPRTNKIASPENVESLLNKK